MIRAARPPAPAPDGDTQPAAARADTPGARGVRRRDAERSRAALLDAAAELFAERGYAGTALRAVGQRAGVDAALIARYFGGKDGLYRAVLAADPLVDAVRPAAAGGAAPGSRPVGTGDEPTAATAGAAAAEPAGPAGAGEGRRGGGPAADAEPMPARDLAELLARTIEQWRSGTATAASQNVFRCGLDPAARQATEERLRERLLAPLRSQIDRADPEAELRIEIAAVVLLGIGVARSAGTLPALAAADPDRLSELAREALDTLLR
ncbi:MAG: TetR family transcriptional regulator [Frankia sp.]|nr:TetR family transcriptional regulator [Frankia sp.]